MTDREIQLSWLTLNCFLQPFSLRQQEGLNRVETMYFEARVQIGASDQSSSDFSIDTRVTRVSE
jgi:hypothetical protein